MCLYFLVNQPQFDRPMDQIGEIVTVQLLHKIVAVMLNGLDAYAQLLGYLAIGLTGRNQVQDLMFTSCRKGLGSFEGRARCRYGLVVVSGSMNAASIRGADGQDQLLNRRIQAYEPAGAFG